MLARLTGTCPTSTDRLETEAEALRCPGLCGNWVNCSVNPRIRVWGSPAFEADWALVERYLDHLGDRTSKEQLALNAREEERKLAEYLPSGQNGPWSLTEDDIHSIFWAWVEDVQ